MLSVSESVVSCDEPIVAVTCNAPSGAMPNEVELGLEALLPRLWRFAISLTRNETCAEDLVQDTCVRVLDKAHQFRPGTHLDRWCFTVMANVWRSGFRRKSIELMDEEALNRLEDEAALQDESLFANQVLQAIDKLPEPQRAVVVLVYGDGFAYREAADILAIPIGTVMSRLHAARKQLAHLAA